MTIRLKKARMKSLEAYALADLKRVYLALHNQLRDDVELMDSELLEDLQRLLQEHAQKEGIDVSHHAQWATWLNGGALLRGV